MKVPIRNMTAVYGSWGAKRESIQKATMPMVREKARKQHGDGWFGFFSFTIDSVFSSHTIRKETERRQKQEQEHW
jgi:hypothetical protein